MKRVDIFHKPTGDEVVHDLIWTVPNLITLIRFLCIPVFVWLIFGPERRFAAAWLLAFLGATDWVDGYLARLLDQGSEIGRILDPTVDRVMFLVAVLAMMIDGSVVIWFAIGVLLREGLVAVAALFLASKGLRTLDVTWVGKTATFALMFTFPFMLAAASGVGGSEIFRWIGWIIGIPALVLSWYSAIGYIKPARAAMEAAGG